MSLNREERPKSITIQQTVDATFASFYNNDQFSDMIYVVNNNIYRAHQIVCAARSQAVAIALAVFSQDGISYGNFRMSYADVKKNQLKQTTIGGGKRANKNIETEQKVAITLNHIEDAIFEGILHYMYKGEVFISRNNCFELYKASIEFKITPLNIEIEKYIINNVINPENMLDIWETAISYGMQDVENHVKGYIKTQFKDIVSKYRGISFETITPQQMRELIMNEMKSQMPNYGMPSIQHQTSQQQQLAPYQYNFFNEQQGQNQQGQQTSPLPSMMNTTMMNEKLSQLLNVNSNNFLNPLSSNYFQGELQTRHSPSSLWDSTPPYAFPHKQTLMSMPQFFNRVSGNQFQVSPTAMQPQQQPAPSTQAQPEEERQPLGSTVDSSIPESSSSSKAGVYVRRMSVISENDDLGTVGVFFQHIIGCVTTLLNCERTTLFIYDAQRNELTSQVSVSDQVIRQNVNEGAAGTAFQSRQPAASSGALCVPLIQDESFLRATTSPHHDNKSEPFGVIEVLNKVHGSFTNNDRLALEIVGKLICIFIKTMEKSGLRLNDATHGKVLLLKRRGRRNSWLDLWVPPTSKEDQEEHRSSTSSSSSASSSTSNISSNQRDPLGSSPEYANTESLQSYTFPPRPSAPTTSTTTSTSSTTTVPAPVVKQEPYDNISSAQSAMMSSFRLTVHDPSIPPSTSSIASSSTPSSSGTTSHPPTSAPSSTASSVPSSSSAISPSDPFFVVQNSSVPPSLNRRRRRRDSAFMHFRIKPYDVRTISFPNESNPSSYSSSSSDTRPSKKLKK